MEEKREVTGKDVLMQLLHYVVICSFLAYLNYKLSPQYWWVGWVACGWGLLVLLKAGEWLIYRKEQK